MNMRDPQADPNFFAEKALAFYESFNIPVPGENGPVQQESIGFITASDQLIDIILRKLEAENSTYSDEFILQFGSALGAAFGQAFMGGWRYSPKQERWVIAYVTPSGSITEVNVFHKLEKRLRNGDEDSIVYMYENLRQMFLAEADALEGKS